MILIVDNVVTLYRDYDAIYMDCCRDDTALISAIKILHTQLSVSVRACRMYLRNYVSLCKYNTVIASSHVFKCVIR